jgi:hypothetical protein
MATKLKAEGGRRKARHAMLAASVAVLLIPGCGYRLAGKVVPAQGGLTLAIPMVKNSTTTFQVEQRLTRALIDVFAQRGGYRVTSSASGADALMEGEIVELSAAPVIIGSESFGTAFLISMRARIRMVDLHTQQVLFRNDQFLFREQYVINGDVTQFFAEANPAIDRMVRDFAQSVAASVLGGR